MLFWEAVNWQLIRSPISDWWVHWTARPHPPMWLLPAYVWVTIFGDQLGWMRALSALCGSVSCLAIGALPWLVFRRPTAAQRWGYTAAAWLYATSSSAVVAARHFDENALTGLMWILAAAAFLRSRRTGFSKACRGLFGLLGIAFCYMHIYAPFYFVSLAAVGILGKPRFEEQCRDEASRQAKPASTVWLVPLLAIVPVFNALAEQLGSLDHDYFVLPDRTARFIIESYAAPTMSLVPRPFARGSAILGAVVVGAAFVCALRGSYQERCFALAFLLSHLLLWCVALLWRKNVVVPAYMLASEITVLLLVGEWLGRFSGPVRSAIFLVAFGATLHNTVRDVEWVHQSPPSGLEQAARILRSSNDQVATVLVTSAHLILPMSYYVRDCPQIRSGLTWVEHPVQWRGRALLVNFQTISVEHLATLSTPELWVVDGFGGWPMRLPPRFVAVETHAFPEFFGWQKDTILYRYRDQAAEPPTGR